MFRSLGIREALIEAIIQETSSKKARKLGGRKLKDYASAKLVRTPPQSKSLGVRLAKRRKRNKAKGYFRQSPGQHLADSRAAKKG